MELSPERFCIIRYGVEEQIVENLQSFKTLNMKNKVQILTKIPNFIEQMESKEMNISSKFVRRSSLTEY